MSFRIETERLVLRTWQGRDADPYHAMCNDNRVMEFLGPPQSREETDAAIARRNAEQAERGYCFWALERQGDHAFLGFCGFKHGNPQTPLEGFVEIGWRLAYDAWGQGYAREAAQAALAWAFATIGISEIRATTAQGNQRSWRLMQRLGMERMSGHDFDNPALQTDDPLRRHITYRKVAGAA